MITHPSPFSRGAVSAENPPQQWTRTPSATESSWTCVSGARKLSTAGSAAGPVTEASTRTDVNTSKGQSSSHCALGRKQGITASSPTVSTT